MSKFEFVIAGLGSIALVGLIVLLALEREITVIVPIVTSIIGWLLGKNHEGIAGAFKKKKETNKKKK